jgi:hypothetical protein
MGEISVATMFTQEIGVGDGVGESVDVGGMMFLATISTSFDVVTFIVVKSYIPSPVQLSCWFKLLSIYNSK